MDDLVSLREILTQRKAKYSIETYGCQMNAHDSEKLAGILEELGYEPGEKSQAELIIFNTCCVRENAELKIFGNVGALKQRKRKNGNLLVAVCGCMMQQEAVAKRLFDTFPFVDIIFGTGNMHRLPEMIARAVLDRKRSFCVEKMQGDMIEDVPVVRNRPPLASVSIMQGCDNFCTYCIVPYVRGRERSRRPDHIVQEVSKLAGQGYREVMLLGQNVNSYGKGLEEEASFPALLRRVARETDIQRIRFMTSHPKDVSPKMLEAMAEEPKIAKQLHLPVQSGSTGILQAMNRKYTREQYLELVDLARRTIPDVTLSTDIIVGFPGETEEDFQATLSLVEQVGFDSAFTFVYSIRRGTKAEKMPGHLSDEVKQRRIVELVAKQGEITYEKNRKRVGKIETVLVESASTRDGAEMCGRTDGGKMANFPGGQDLIGRFVKVKITEGKKTTLHGEIVK